MREEWLFRIGGATLVLVAMFGGSAPPAAAGQTDGAYEAPDAEPVVFDRLVAELADSDPAVRDRARLITLNLGAESDEELEAALARPGLSPAARAVLKEAEPRLKARARALAEQIRDNRWKRKSLLDEWNRLGHKDPQWDLWVEDGIRSFSRDGFGAALQNFEKAVDAGCDDALVLSLRARSGAPGDSGVEGVERYRAAAQAMLKSKYSPARKAAAFAAYFRAGKELPHDIPLDTLVNLTVEASKDPDVPRLEIWSTLYGISPKLCSQYGWEGAFQRLDPAFERAFANQWYAPYFKGVFNVYWAWDARGSGTADTVTPQGWKLFEQRIETASNALEQAWKLDPTQSLIAEQMVTVCMAQSDRRGVEKWFRRGIAVNPDSQQICANKLYALTPRWLGSHEEMLAFGRECTATENYYGGIADIIVAVHKQIAADGPDVEAYMRRPEVWNDIHKALEDRILLDPSPYFRSRYVNWAARCGHWEVIPAQCKILGDHPDPTIFPDKRIYDAIRAHALAETHAPANATP